MNDADSMNPLEFSELVCKSTILTVGQEEQTMRIRD